MTTFNVGDRVVSLPGSEWDNDLSKDDPDYDIVVFAGNYGHVVEECFEDGFICNGEMIHVRFEGAIDNRRMPTIWTNSIWHVFSHEIEHID